MKRARSQHGLSLVEATIILLALMTLGGVLAPSIMDYVDDARWVKVKEDCEAIGLSLARLVRDVGPCLKMDGRRPCTIDNRVDLLVSEGNEVEGYAGWTGTTYAQAGYSGSAGGYTTASYTTATTSSGGSTGGVNYVTEYVPRPVPAGTVWKDATHLGGSTAFYSLQLVTTASLKRMVEAEGLASDIRAVLRDSGIPEAADGVIATLQALSETTSPTGSLEACSRVEPPLGSVVECQLEVGETLQWMAYRPGARSGNRAPKRLEYVRWAGKEPVRSFAFRVETDNEVLSFIIPAPCANLALMSVMDISQREVAFEGTPASQSTTTTTTSRSSGRSSGSYGSYGVSRAGCSGGAWWANARAPIGWYHTPLWAGTPNGHPNVDFIENQLIRNWPAGSEYNHYPLPGQVPFPIGPRFNLGWRGAYISEPVGNDPWGHKYFVNTLFLFAFGNQPSYEGYSSWTSDTFCLSAGPNGWVETPFASDGCDPTPYDAGYGAWYGNSGGTVRGGDDFVYVIAGGSR